MFPLLWRCRSSLPHYAQPWVQRLAHSIDPGTQRRVDLAVFALGGADLGVIEEAANHYRCFPAGLWRPAAFSGQIRDEAARPFLRTRRSRHDRARRISARPRRPALGPARAGRSYRPHTLLKIDRLQPRARVSWIRVRSSDLMRRTTQTFRMIDGRPPDGPNTRRQPVPVENPKPRFVLSRIAHTEGVGPRNLKEDRHEQETHPHLHGGC